MIIEKIRTRYRHRPDTEHLQGLLRIVVSVCFVAYILIVLAFLPGINFPNAHLAIAFGIMSSLSGFVSAIGTLNTTKISHARRWFGMISDISLTSLTMIFAGGIMAPAYIIYLWVSMGNGARYGKQYLACAITMSVVAFGIVIALTPFWQSIPSLAGGLLAGLVILPIFIFELLKQLRQSRDNELMANQAKTRFLTNISHEFRTPLTGILGNLQLLSAMPLPKEEAGYVQQIQSSACYLNNLIKDMLDLSTIEAGKIRIEEVDFNLGEATDFIVETLRPQTLKNNITLKVECDPRCPDWLHGPKDHLYQVLLNVAGNAVKFTHPGGEVILRIAPATKLLLDGKSALQFTVTDNGPGIPADALPKIFEPFDMGRRIHHPNTPSTGLGLAISHGLVMANNGTIDIVSEPDKGTVTRFTLPFGPSSPEAAGNARNSGIPMTTDTPKAAPCNDVIHLSEHFDKLAKSSQGSPLKVLLLDDHRSNLLLLEKVLAKCGHRSESFLEADDALDAFANQRYDLAILDYRINGVTGADVIRQVRLMEAGTGRKTPMIISTADLCQEARKDILQSGADGFLPKPFNVLDLVQMINKVIQVHRRSSAPKPLPVPTMYIPDSIGMAQLDQLKRIMGDQLKPYLEDTLKEVSLLMQQVALRISTREWALLRESLHALQGIAGNIGLNRLVEAAEDMKKSPDGDAHLHLARLEGVFTSGKAWLLNQENGDTSSELG